MVDSEALKAGCPHTSSPEPCSICKAGDELAGVVGECEQDRLNAQLSGLKTGWEHPGTHVSFRKVLAFAKAYRKARGER